MCTCCNCGKCDVTDLQCAEPMGGTDTGIGVRSGDFVEDRSECVEGVGMDLVFEFGDRSAMIMIPNGADELRDRTVRRILHVRVQCGDVDHRIGDDGERLHAKMLVLVVTCSLRNQVWNDRQQNLQTLLDRLHRSWKIHDQGPSMESCEATTDCRHRIRLHSVCSQRLRHSWQFQLEELFRRLWSDISRRDTSSAGRDDHVEIGRSHV